MKTAHLKILTVVGVILIIGLLAERFDSHPRPAHPSASATTTTTTQPAEPTTTGTGNGTVAARSYKAGDCVMWNQAILFKE